MGAYRVPTTDASGYRTILTLAARACGEGAWQRAPMPVPQMRATVPAASLRVCIPGPPALRRWTYRHGGRSLSTGDRRRRRGGK
jgi:hypothetical protein